MCMHSFFLSFLRQKANRANAKMHTTKEKHTPSPRGGGVHAFSLASCVQWHARFIDDVNVKCVTCVMRIHWKALPIDFGIVRLLEEHGTSLSELLTP